MEKQTKVLMLATAVIAAFLYACSAGSSGSGGTPSGITSVSVKQVGTEDNNGFGVSQLFGVGGVAYMTYISGNNESGNIINYSYINEDSGSGVEYTKSQVVIPENLSYSAFGNLLFTSDKKIYLSALNLNESSDYQQVMLKFNLANQYESTIGILGESWSMAISYGITKMGKLYVNYDTGDTEDGSLCNMDTSGYSTAVCHYGVLPGWYTGEFALKDGTNNAVYISKTDGLYVRTSTGEKMLGNSYDTLIEKMGVYIEPGLIQEYNGKIYVAGETLNLENENSNLAICSLDLVSDGQWKCYAATNYTFDADESLGSFALDQSSKTLLFQMTNYQTNKGKLFSLPLASLVNG